MASGIVVSDDVITTYKDIKMGQKFKYAFCRISDDKESVIVCGKSKETDYEHFLSELPSDEPLYVIYDFHYLNKEGAKRTEVILISWCPDCTPVKKRMLHAATKDALKKKLGGNKDFQATEISDIAEDVLRAELQRKG